METAVPLSTLPAFGIFKTMISGLRGLILRWVHRGAAWKSEALVLLLCGGYTERRRLRGGLMVRVDDRDASINAPYGRPALGEKDPFLHRWLWSKSDRRVAMPLLPMAQRMRVSRSEFPISVSCGEFA